MKQKVGTSKKMNNIGKLSTNLLEGERKRPKLIKLEMKK
jgi:hypothetical protein